MRMMQNFSTYWFILIRIKILMLIFILLGFFITCSNYFSGGSSDHGNAIISGIVIDANNTPIAHAKVLLLSQDYNPIKENSSLDSLSTTTNSSGYFRIPNIQSGEYCLTVANKQETHYATKKSIHLDTDDIVSIPLELSLPGKIKIPINPSMFPDIENISLYIPGTCISKTISASNTLLIETVPNGQHTLMAFNKITKKSTKLGIEYTNFYVESSSITDFTLSPTKPHGPTSAFVNEECTFLTLFNVEDSLPLEIIPLLQYRFSWGDSSTSNWTSYPRNIHVWSEPGVYTIRSQMRLIAPVISSFINIPDSTDLMRISNFYSKWSDASFVEIIEQRNM